MSRTQLSRAWNKLCRAPRTLGMLTRIEWAQFRSRGARGYLRNRSKDLRNRLERQYPRALQIEPYGGCNIRCAMCFQGRMDLPGDRNAMDLDMYRRIIDQVSPVTPMLYLYWRGEPLMHDGFATMVRYARDRGMYVFTSTNAVLLDERRALEIIDAGLDFLLVGFDGATAESYEAMRKGAHFDQVRDNVLGLLRLRREHRARLPHVCLQFIISSINEHELDAARRLARRMGADSFTEKILDVYENFHSARVARSLLPLYVDGAWSKYDKHGDAFEFARGLPRCEMARRMVVRADGRLSLCCYDMQGAYPIGTAAAEVDLLALWKSRAYAHLRSRGENRSTPLCTNCGAGLQR